jgi:predicted RNase H-like HicB family nuclease
VNEADHPTNSYSTLVFWSVEDDAWVAIVPEWKGVSAFGKTRLTALQELEVALGLAIENTPEGERPSPQKLDTGEPRPDARWWPSDGRINDCEGCYGAGLPHTCRPYRGPGNSTKTGVLIQTAEAAGVVEHFSGIANGRLVVPSNHHGKGNDGCELDPVTGEAIHASHPHCQTVKATTIVGANGQWRVCDSCAKHPALNRYSVRTPIARKD